MSGQFARRMMLAIALAVIVAFPEMLIHAGWGDKQIRYRYMTPPSKELPGVKRIAVMDFDGPYGRVVSDSMIEAIAGAHNWISKHPWGESATPKSIEPIERSRLEAVLQEQQLSGSGLVNEASGAAKIGELLGVDAIVFGSTNQDVKDTVENRKETRTKNDQTYEVIVPYHTRTARLTAQARVVEATSGKILATLNNSGVMSATDTVFTNLPNPAVLLDQAARPLGAGFGSLFSPGQGFGTARLEKVKSLLKEKADRDKRDRVEDDCKAAAESAERGRLQDAWRTYMAAFQLDEYNDLIASNIGSLYEAIGDYENGLKYFKIAQEYNSSSQEYRAAISRVGFEMASRSKLHELGYIERPMAFNAEAAQEAIAKASVPRIRIRKGGTRLLSEADDGSKVIGNLPKDMTLEVLEEKQVGRRVFYHVKTATGKDGWLPDDDIEKI